VIDERTRRVARWVSEFLKHSGNRWQKTIVFCVDTEHAARMRQALLNENADLAQDNPRYVMRITGDDHEGTAQLSNFIDPEATYPVIVTTSRLLSTGVDAQTCRLIVLDREVGSMTEFKQIVGRGTRVHEDTRKYYFTLIDFRKATNHFADPDFDGEPVQSYEPGEAEEGLLLDPLQEEVGKELDPFDLVCHIAFDQPPLTRRERVAKVRKRDVFTQYGPQARAVLDALLDKYQDEGVVTGLDDPRLLQIAPFASMGTVPQLIKHFGTRADFERAVHALQTALYEESA
jgi:type I site-specific restriction endonuclease